MRKIVGLLLGLSLIVPAAFAGFPEDRESGRRDIIGRGDIEAPRPGDYAKDLVDQYAISNLAKMEERGLLTATLEQSPWTDSYWPTYAGGLANRYGDARYSPSYEWSRNETYLRRWLGRGNSRELSPAEKYDLLLGDPDFSLTRYMLESSAGSVGADGQIETWFGLCHGWAAASFMMPRPSKGVKVRGANGQEIFFTPSDLKALGTLLWANAPTKTRFVGGRCNKENPRRGPNGREIDPECLDSNPATWHLAAVNQLGVARRSFVLDAESGAEVWNQPAYSYRYSYVNPITGKSTEKLSEARVALRDFQDPHSENRSISAEFLVNVEMELTYVVESEPSLAAVDGPDSYSHVVYKYDLELDRENNIVGGEWHSTNHPDFLWVPVAGAKALSVGDYWLFRTGDKSEWQQGQEVPGSWREAARRSVAQGQPLAVIVERLYDLSNR